MQKSKQIALGLITVFAISIFTISNASAEKQDNSKQGNVWDIISDIQNQISVIQAKLSTTVSVNGNTGSGISTPPSIVGTHDHPHKVKVKHTPTHNTSFSPSDPNVYYTSLTMGGDVPIQPILQQSDISPPCNSVNVGTVDNPDYEVLGWCPDSHQTWYFIDDARVTANSLISMNIQAPPVTDSQEAVNPPKCSPTSTGVFQFADGQHTGFVIQCDSLGDIPVANEPLIYIVLN